MMLWLENIAKAHFFANSDLSKTQGYLKCETLGDIFIV